jgi:hypothetical protein
MTWVKAGLLSSGSRRFRRRSSSLRAVTPSGFGQQAGVDGMARLGVAVRWTGKGHGAMVTLDSRASATGARKEEDEA